MCTWCPVSSSPNLDKQTAKGNTALHYCCLLDNRECLKLLLRGRASVSISKKTQPSDDLRKTVYERCFLKSVFFGVFLTHTLDLKNTEFQIRNMLWKPALLCTGAIIFNLCWTDINYSLNSIVNSIVAVQYFVLMWFKQTVRLSFLPHCLSFCSAKRKTCSRFLNN